MCSLFSCCLYVYFVFYCLFTSSHALWGGGVAVGGTRNSRAGGRSSELQRRLTSGTSCLAVLSGFLTLQGPFGTFEVLGGGLLPAVRHNESRIPNEGRIVSQYIIPLYNMTWDHCSNACVRNLACNNIKLCDGIRSRCFSVKPTNTLLVQHLVLVSLQAFPLL